MIVLIVGNRTVPDNKLCEEQLGDSLDKQPPHAGPRQLCRTVVGRQLGTKAQDALQTSEAELRRSQQKVK